MDAVAKIDQTRTLPVTFPVQAIVIPGGVGDGFYGTHFVLHFRRQCRIKNRMLHLDTLQIRWATDTSRPWEAQKLLFRGAPLSMPSWRLERVETKLHVDVSRIRRKIT